MFTPANEVIRYERKNKNVIFEDQQHTLWILPPEGNLSYYDREKKELKSMLKDSNNPKSVFSPLVRFYTLDNQGNCWLTSARGIYKLSFFPHTYNLVHIDDGFETRAFYATVKRGCGFLRRHRSSECTNRTDSWEAI